MTSSFPNESGASRGQASATGVLPVSGWSFMRRLVTFTMVGLVLYGGLYAWSEQLVYQHAKRNRFFMVKTADEAPYDVVILGASHAAVFDYGNMNDQLEGLTGARILNLSVLGAGVVVNRLLLDYFLATRQTQVVLYVADSFTFTSREWNETRVQDAQLLARAPFDPTLVRLLLSRAETRAAAWPYLTGFAKVNNADRFAPDIRDDETSRFDRTYRPVPQIDQQRLRYLYPEAALGDLPTHDRYFSAFAAMLAELRARGILVMVVKPPLPARVSAQLPGEAAFDARLRGIVEAQGAHLHDFSAVNNDETMFYDTDHLNRTGVTQFFEHYLSPMLQEALRQRKEPR